MRMQIGGEEHTAPAEPLSFSSRPGMRHGAVYDPDEPKEYVVFRLWRP